MWHAESVTAWLVVMVAVVVIALALTVYGALHDRSVNRRRAAEMLGPPQRTIPNLPADARAPTYVPQAQARRRPGGSGGAPSKTLTEDPAGTVVIGVGYASADFVTGADAREVVLDEPLVLVCADEVGTVRELLPALEQALRDGRPLVVVAPGLAREVLDTLEVNAIQGLVRGVAVLADESVRARVAEVSGAEAVDVTDLRSGWLGSRSLGHLARWTSGRTSSRMTPSRVGAAG